MVNSFVQEQLAQIQAAKAAKLAEQAAQGSAPAPAAAPGLAVVQPPPEPAAPPPVTESPAGPKPVKPASCPQADWDMMPDDVKTLVALGAAGQAEPVNPPEIAAGLVASVTGKPAETPAQPAQPAEEPVKRGRGRPPKAAVEAASAIVQAPAGLDLSELVSELRGIRLALEEANKTATVQADAQQALVQALPAALHEIAEVVSGAAQVLA